jgi:Flp pilus assembly protein, ATPase CpaF
MFRILVDTPNREQRQVRCLHNECGIGRGDANLVMLQGWSIGQQHAVIRRLADGLYLEQLEGRATVNLNGKRISGRQGPLRDQDRIEIGDYRLQVIDETPPAPAVVPAPAPAPTLQAAAHDIPASVPAVAASSAAPTSQQLAHPAELPPDMTSYRASVHKALVKQMDLRRVDVRGMDDDDPAQHHHQADRRGAHARVRRPAQGGQPPSAGQGSARRGHWLGPLEDLLDDPTVTEIMVNAHDMIFIERGGQIQKSAVNFTDDRAVLSAIERIVTPLGRRIDESSPLVDARLKDGSRVNAVIPPVALRGPSISIRKFPKHKLVGEDLVRFGSLSPAMLQFLIMAVRERKNIVVIGGTGSGKTTLLNILSNFIPDTDRVVTIEDAAELKLVQPNLVALEARPPTWKARATFPSATWSRTRCACVRTGSWSVSAVAARRWTCCRP